MSSQIGETGSGPRRGRPRNFDAGDLMDAVTDTFWRRGYGATSIDDLVAASGAARASLYRLHGDKRALLIAALGHYADRFDARVAETLERGLPARDGLRETLTASAERLCGGVAPPGCLRCRMTLELAGTDPQIDAAIADATERFEAGMARLLQSDGPRADAAPRALFLLAVVNGMVVMAIAGADRAALDTVIDAALMRLDAA